MTSTPQTVPVLPTPVVDSRPRATKRDRRPFSIGRLLGWIVLIVSLILTVFPFYWMLKTALTPAADVIRDSGALFPGSPTFVNFARVLGFLTPAEDPAAGGSGAAIN